MEVEEGNKEIPEISPPNTRRKKYISCYRCMSQQCVCVKSSKNVKELKSKMIIGKRDTKHKKLQNTGSAAKVYQEKQCKNRTKTKSVVEKEDKEEDTPWQSRYVCRVCGSIFKEKVPWINHIERKHYHAYKLQCDKCYLPFSNEYETSSHICTCANIRNHTCIFCSDEKSFRYKTNLYYHIMQEHDSKFPLRCEKCAKPLASKLEQTQHIATHSCSTIMKDETRLKQFATEHQMQIQYKENGDDSTTATKSRHSNKTEVAGAKTTNLPLCEYCGRVVKQLSAHTDVCLNNKYKCSTSEMTLNSKMSLKIHIMRFHTSRNLTHVISVRKDISVMGL
ncbi:zinc finger protein 711-like [Mercenaria mercenaria]|uniref:zinc finger protein 711-like n=1 Tax=Mercenaria mercenaria TaxID=6596 RepID=UPI00234EE553|nr:zinc finger protein 711-like [Mercenaria mercenaria]